MPNDLHALLFEWGERLHRLNHASHSNQPTTPAAPQMHLAYTAAGAVIGYGFHVLDQNQQRDAAAIKAKHEHLIAEQYHSVQAQLGEDAHHH